MDLPVGELFMLGFRGPRVPAWMRAFAGEFGLGGVILFDYDCLDKKFERNIFSRAQVEELCAEIHALPSRPLIFVDQEGGKVRRLKEEYGFSPLPSARAFGRLSAAERLAVARPAYKEMREAGIDVNLAPAVDLDINPQSPDVGSAQRSYSADPNVVEQCVAALDLAAREAGLRLCLKHFPGTGGAKVDPHTHVMDLSDCLTDAQVEIFMRLLPSAPMILLSHGIVNQWERTTPVCLSRIAVDKVRAVAPDAHILTDDLQMQGVQKLAPTIDACVRAVTAGADLLVIGNNLKDEQEQSADFARAVRAAAQANAHARANVEASIRRMRKLKSH